MEDSSLSTAAQNVQIFTRGKSVTLSGPVESENEKVRLERLAKGVAGNMKVVNEVTVTR